MAKVTYLFGAGASRNALPIVNEIPERITKLIQFLESASLQLDDKSTFDDLKIQNSKSKKEYQNEMIDSLKWLQGESKNHASVDTLAKKLTIQGKNKTLEKLKIALSVFFIFEQAFNKPDYRYDAFFASILDRKYEFPDNISILSWNYDYQFELAYSEYSGSTEISSNQNYLRVKSKFEKPSKSSGFGIFKINGTTGLGDGRGFRQFVYTENLKREVDKSFVEEITRNFAAAMHLGVVLSTLSFAWEPDFREEKLMDAIVENIKDTESLVVIGYSFPFFNRQIDKQIIEAMKILRRVYFQAPDADVLKERFQSLADVNTLTGVKLLSKTDVGQFFIPFEL